MYISSVASSPIGGVARLIDSSDEVEDVDGGGLTSLITLRGPESDRAEGALLPMTEGEAV